MAPFPLHHLSERHSSRTSCLLTPKLAVPTPQNRGGCGKDGIFRSQLEVKRLALPSARPGTTEDGRAPRVSVSLGCHDKVPQTGRLKHDPSQFRRPGGPGARCQPIQSLGQALGRAGSRPGLRTASFSTCARVALTASWAPPALTSWDPQHLPKAPSPSNITWGLGLPHMNFAGDTVRSVSPCLPVFLTTAVLVPAREGGGQAGGW